MADLHYSDIVAVLQQAGQAADSDGALTHREIERAMNLGNDAVERRLRLAIEAGTITWVWTRRECRGGMVKPTIGYKLVGGKI